MDYKKFILELVSKLRGLALSRKFWVLAAALVVIGEQASNGAITPWQAIQALIAALTAYSASVAYEDGQRVKAAGAVTSARVEASGQVAAAEVAATVEAPPAQ